MVADSRVVKEIVFMSLGILAMRTQSQATHHLDYMKLSHERNSERGQASFEILTTTLDQEWLSISRMMLDHVLNCVHVTASCNPNDALLDFAFALPKCLMT